MGALLVVPVMASVAVIMEYLRRRVLGLSPFAEDVIEQGSIPDKAAQSKGKPRITSRSN
jgi:hypothetical protein